MGVSICLGFVFHLVGDYLFQNDWMAREKVRNDWVALLHASLYSALFLFLVDWWGMLILLGSHFLIDRLRLAVYWIRLVNWRWDGDNLGYGEGKPKWMSVWLMIIIDNTWHVVINTGCILFFGGGVLRLPVLG